MWNLENDSETGDVETQGLGREQDRQDRKRQDRQDIR